VWKIPNGYWPDCASRRCRRGKIFVAPAKRVSLRKFAWWCYYYFRFCCELNGRKPEGILVTRKPVVVAVMTVTGGPMECGETPAVEMPSIHLCALNATFVKLCQFVPSWLFKLEQRGKARHIGPRLDHQSRSQELADRHWCRVTPQ